MQAEQPIASYNGTPQLEDGFTRIANELLLAVIQFKFSERQYKILFALIRKTYGFNKVNDEISLSQLSAICNLPVNHISTVINQLVKLNVIIKKQGKHAHSLGINKLYDTWGGLHNVECLNVELLNVDNGVTSSGVLQFPNVEVQKTTPKYNTKDSCLEVLNYLNTKSKKNFRNVKANIDLIKARLKEYSVEDLKMVVDTKVANWVNDEKMNQFIRPSTLFNATNCAQYVSEQPKAAEKPSWMKGMLSERG